MIVATSNRQIVASDDALAPKARNAEDSECKAVASDEADRPQSAERATGEGGEECQQAILSSDAGREGRSPDNARRRQGAEECQSVNNKGDENGGY